MKLFIALLVGMAAGQVQAASESLIGRWLDRDYIFVLNDEWQDVTGSWGELQYDIGWDGVYKEMKGNSAGMNVSVEFQLDQHKIFSTVPCGWADFEYTVGASPKLMGAICTKPVEKIFVDEKALLGWIKSALFLELVQDFPEPVRPKVHAFFLKTANF